MTGRAVNGTDAGSLIGHRVGILRETGQMDADSSQKLLVVVGLIDPLGVGTAFSRREWPAHVTLASNFIVDETESGIARAIGEVCAGAGPLPVRFGGDAMFGPEKDVPVQLVESAPIISLHSRIADRLERMPGFAAREPTYWRAGYRPHMTRVPSLALHEGDRLLLPVIAIAEMTGSRATVSAEWHLSPSPRA